ncbi:hypothetical protein ES332_A03G237700v1, partial [Gossypium tomentosum]
HRQHLPSTFSSLLSKLSYIFLFFPLKHTFIKNNNSYLPASIVSSKKVPKGYFAVYFGENQKRFVIPVSFLNHPSFQDFLGMSQEEFRYSHPTGGLTIPCNEDTFLEVTSRMY